MGPLRRAPVLVGGVPPPPGLGALRSGENSAENSAKTAPKHKNRKTEKQKNRKTENQKNRKIVRYGMKAYSSEHDGLYVSNRECMNDDAHQPI